MQAAQAMLVIQRQRVHQHVIGGPPPGRHRGPDRGRELAVGQRHAFGPARSCPRCRRAGRCRAAEGVPAGRSIPRQGRAGDIARPPRWRGARLARPGPGRTVSEGQHAPGVGDQVARVRRRCRRGSRDNDHARPKRAEVAANEAEARAGREQHRSPRAAGPPARRRHPGPPRRSSPVGDRLAVDRDRDPVRNPVARTAAAARESSRPVHGACTPAGRQVRPPARGGSTQPLQATRSAAAPCGAPVTQRPRPTGSPRVRPAAGRAGRRRRDQLDPADPAGRRGPQVGGSIAAAARLRSATRLTSPRASASAASSQRPVSTRSMAGPRPTSAGSSQAPTARSTAGRAGPAQPGRRTRRSAGRRRRRAGRRRRPPAPDARRSPARAW